MSTTQFSATMQTVAATACADGSLHRVLDSLGPIELGYGVTVLRRHLSIVHVILEAVAWSKEKVKCFLDTHLDATTTNGQVHVDCVMVGSR